MEGDFTFSCPCCSAALRVPPELKETLARELRHWDRRFDRAETIVESLLSLLSELETHQVVPPPTGS